MDPSEIDHILLLPIEIFSTLLSTLCFRAYNLLILKENRSGGLLKILVSVVRFRPWAPRIQKPRRAGFFYARGLGVVEKHRGSKAA